mmetsp:Transcript_40955/g.59848  ORF Transcript_40955/g.59848 Transcript_40955/m.59848 type:complete len:138 (+) Transcript_40955:1-414(+)
MARPPPEPPPLHATTSRPIQRTSTLQTATTLHPKTSSETPRKNQGLQPKKTTNFGWKRGFLLKTPMTKPPAPVISLPAPRNPLQLSHCSNNATRNIYATTSLKQKSSTVPLHTTSTHSSTQETSSFTNTNTHEPSTT